MAGGEYRVEVHGSVGGNLIVGDHNLVVNAATGSYVQVLQEAQRPRPVRRESIRILPRRPAALLGRRAELGEVTAAVVARSTIGVFGPGGMGKSTLLRQAAHDLADETGVLFLSAAGRGPLDVTQDIFEACYDTSGYRPGPAELTRLMTGVRVCVLADDLECTPDQLRSILDAAPDAAFVVSSREREVWGEGRALELAGLPAEAALDLVRREIGRELTGRESAVVLAEWRVGGGSPMSVLRAAATLGHAPAPPGQPAVPGQPAAAGHPATSGEAAASGRAAPPGAAGGGQVTARDPGEQRAAIVAGLTPPERDAFGLMRAIGRARVAPSAVAALAKAPDLADVEAALARLASVGLVESAGESYRIAEDVAAEPPEAPYRRNTLKLVASMLEWLAVPERDARAVAEHSAAIVSLVDAAVREGAAAEGVRLARAAAPILALSLRWGAWRDVLTAGQAAAEGADDREALAYFTHERGIRMLCLGQVAAAAAVLGTAAALWQAAGLGHSASLALSAQAVANGGTGVGGAAAGGVPPQGSPGGPQTGGGGGSGSGPAGGGAGSSGAGTGSAGRPPGRRAPRRAVGRASVPQPSKFPVALVTTLAVVLAALVVAGIYFVPKLNQGHAAPDSPIVPSSTGPSSPMASPTPPCCSPPQPVAFSEMTADRYDPASVLDKDPSTIWVSQPEPESLNPAWIGIDMGQPVTMNGLSVTPVRGLAGWPLSFQIETSPDMTTWTPVPGQEYDFEKNPYKPGVGPQDFVFASPVTARYVRFYATRLRGAGAGISVDKGDFRLAVADMQVIAG